jgi:hypothetical protein
MAAIVQAQGVEKIKLLVEHAESLDPAFLSDQVQQFAPTNVGLLDIALKRCKYPTTVFLAILRLNCPEPVDDAFWYILNEQGVYSEAMVMRALSRLKENCACPLEYIRNATLHRVRIEESANRETCRAAMNTNIVLALYLAPSFPEFFSNQQRMASLVTHFQEGLDWDVFSVVIRTNKLVAIELADYTNYVFTVDSPFKWDVFETLQPPKSPRLGLNLLGAMAKEPDPNTRRRIGDILDTMFKTLACFNLLSQEDARTLVARTRNPAAPLLEKHSPIYKAEQILLNVV